ncbi:MAG: tetratricopeptide repeat protein [Acidobacteriaceae bacterium]|jgi:TPR repeat protein
MKSTWKAVAIFIACAAMIAGIGFGWHAYRTKRKLTETAAQTRQRAELGDAQAESDLSGMYYYGTGVPQSYLEAANWARKSANQGYARAQYRLGYLYMYGQGLPQDYAIALQWYRKAADQNYAYAQGEIGRLYYYGNGVPQDYFEAARWYRLEANQGSAAGQDSLGIAYFHGNGVPQDYAEAFDLFHKAADQGNMKAEYNLGSMYYYGRGVAQNRAEAYRWFSKAAAQGHEDANRVLSLNLTPIGKFNLVLDFLVGGWLTLNFVSFNYLVPHKSLRGFQQRIITGAGLVWLSFGGMTWYGYTHHKIRALIRYPNTFTWLREALFVVAIACLFYAVRISSRKNEAPEDEDIATGEPQDQT